MAFSLVHKFESLKADGADATEIQPSNWNDEHDLILDGPGLIGRTAAGTGPASVLDLNDFRLPAGAAVAFFGNYCPSGYLYAMGTAVSRTTYADLFTAIGTRYGAGDGSTTFNLPNTSGRVLAGREAVETYITAAFSGFSGATLGAAGGGQAITLTAAQQASMPISGASVTGTVTLTSPTGVVNTGGYGTLLGQSAPSGGFNIYSDVTPVLAFSGSLSGNALGGGQPHGNVQPTMICNWIIKT